MSIDLLSLVNTRLALDITRSSFDLESCRFLDRSNARNKVLLDIGSPKKWGSTHLQSQNWVYPLPPRVLVDIHCPVHFIVNYFRQFFSYSPSTKVVWDTFQMSMFDYNLVVCGR